MKKQINTIFQIIIAIVFLYFISNCSGNQNSIETYIKNGHSFYNGGFYHDAIDNWKKALELSPGDTNLFFLLAKANQQIARFELSNQFLEKVIAQNGNEFDAYFMKIQNELFISDLDDVKKLCSRFEARFPNRYKTMILKGDIAAFERDYANAETCYHQAYQLDRQNSAALYKLAAILLVQNKVGLADNYFRRAIDLGDKTSVQYWFHRAAYQTIKGNSQNAENAMRKALSLQPHSYFLKLKICQLLMTYKKYNTLISFFNEYNIISADNPEILKLCAEALLNTNQLEKAITLLKDHEFSNDPDWLLLLGKKSLLQGSFSLASSYFEQVLSIQKNDPNASYMLAISYFAGDKVNLAIHTLTRLLTMYPEMTEAELALATIYYKKKEYDLSIAYLNRVIDNAPENSRPYIMLGNCLLSTGQLDEAESNFQKALVLDGNSLTARYYLALAKEQIGLPDVAIKLYRLILSESPNKADVGLRLANLLIREKRFETAIGIFKSYVDDYPQNGYFKLLLGDVYHAKQDEKTAAYYYRLSVETNPELAEGYKKLAELQDDKNKKIAIIKDALKNIPEFIDLMMYLAGVYFENNNLDSSLEIMERAHKIYPKNAAVSNNLSWLYLEKGINLSTAYELALSALETNPKNHFYAHTLGWALHRKGFYRKAEWQLTESLKLLDKLDNPAKQKTENISFKAVCTYHLALTQLETDQIKEAKKNFASAIGFGLPRKYEIHARGTLSKI